MSEMQPVVVGVDGSEVSRETARWAAAEARLRACPLHLVHVYNIPVFAGPPTIPPYDWTGIFERGAEAVMSEAHDIVRAEAPDLSVTTRVTMGGAAKVLADASHDATMVVVGHRGEGALGALGLGSIAWKVATHAHSPVVIIPPGTPATGTGPVVVGVDGSEHNQPAIGFALQEASLRSVPLHAVYAWEPQSAQVAEVSYDAAEFETAARAQLRTWLAPWQEKFPHVTTKLLLVTGHPATSLLDNADGAGLLVVGTRGRGGFSRLLLGSVSHQVIQHASCPVAVVR